MSRARVVALELAVPIILLALWWVISDRSKAPYFPPLRVIIARFGALYIWAHFGDVVYSVTHFLIGMPLGAAVGFSVGLALGMSDRLRTNLAPVTEYSRATPIVALIPLGLLIAGPGATLEIGLIALGCNWAVMLNTADGVRGVDPQLVETAQSYGLSRRQQLRTIVIPAAMPQVFAGLRVAVGIGVVVMVTANMFANSRGLGAQVVQAEYNFDIRGSWAGIIMIAIVGVVITGIYMVIQSRALAWHAGWRKSAGTK